MFANKIAQQETDDVALRCCRRPVSDVPRELCSSGRAGAGGCPGDWDEDPKERHIGPGMKSTGEGQRV